MGMACERCGRDVSASEGNYVFYQNGMMFVCNSCAGELKDEIRRAQKICEAVNGKRTQAEVEPSKKENTPSKQSSNDSKDKPQARQSDRNSPTEDRNSNGKPSVLARLEANRKFLEERERKEQEHELLVPRRRETKDKDNAR